jgi:hypothetical protein
VLLSTKGRQLPLCPFGLPFLSRPSVDTLSQYSNQWTRPFDFLCLSTNILDLVCWDVLDTVAASTFTIRSRTTRGTRNFDRSSRQVFLARRHLVHTWCIGGVDFENHIIWRFLHTELVRCTFLSMYECMILVFNFDTSLGKVQTHYHWMQARMGRAWTPQERYTLGTQASTCTSISCRWNSEVLVAA